MQNQSICPLRRSLSLSANSFTDRPKWWVILPQWAQASSESGAPHGAGSENSAMPAVFAVDQQFPLGGLSDLTHIAAS